MHREQSNTLSVPEIFGFHLFLSLQNKVALKNTQISIGTNSRSASGFANLKNSSFWTGFALRGHGMRSVFAYILQMLPENATQLIRIQSGRTPGLQILDAFLLELDLDGY